MQNLAEKAELTDELRARKILIRAAWHFIKQMKEAQEELRNAGNINTVDDDFELWHASSTMGGLEVSTIRPKNYIKRVDSAFQKYKEAYGCLKFLDEHVRKNGLDHDIPLPRTAHDIANHNVEYSCWPVNLYHS